MFSRRLCLLINQRTLNLVQLSQNTLKQLSTVMKYSETSTGTMKQTQKIILTFNVTDIGTTQGSNTIIH